MEELAEEAARYIKVNASQQIDQAVYKARYELLSDEYQNAKSLKDKLEKQLEDKKKKSATLEQVIRNLGKLETMEDFDENLWVALIEYATVNKDGAITFILRGGQ